MKDDIVSIENPFPLGPSALSDQELLAIILGEQHICDPTHKQGQELLELLDQSNCATNLDCVTVLSRLKTDSAMTIIASLEFARRRIRPEGVKVREPKDILPLVMHLADRKQEHFLCLSLNGAHEVIKTRVITVGLINATQVHPREVFCDAISDRAVSIVVAHNHPSGELTPSKEDSEITKRLKAAGEIIGIRLLDHIIFSPRGYYSFQEHSLL